MTTYRRTLYECKQKEKDISHISIEIKQKQKVTIRRDCAKRQPLQIKSSFLFTTTVDKKTVLGKSHKAFVLQPSSPILFTPFSSHPLAASFTLLMHTEKG